MQRCATSVAAVTENDLSNHAQPWSTRRRTALRMLDFLWNHQRLSDGGDIRRRLVKSED